MFIIIIDMNFYTIKESLKRFVDSLIDSLTDSLIPFYLHLFLPSSSVQFFPGHSQGGSRIYCILFTNKQTNKLDLFSVLFGFFRYTR